MTKGEKIRELIQKPERSHQLDSPVGEGAIYMLNIGWVRGGWGLQAL